MVYLSGSATVLESVAFIDSALWRVRLLQPTISEQMAEATRKDAF